MSEVLDFDDALHEQRRRNQQADTEQAEEQHEFHLLDQLTAYCICGWVAKIEITATLKRADETPYDAMSDLINFWHAHIKETT